MQAARNAPSEAPAHFGFSVVILTYARDTALQTTLASLRNAIGDRQDVEVVLVDNNVDTIDRASFLTDFAHSRYVRTGANKGVSGRNDGMAVAKGEILVLLDDDVLIESHDLFDKFSAAFTSEPRVGVVNARKLDSKTMSLLPEFIPHTRKDVDTTRPFLTFRFVGGLVALRRALYQDVGGFSPEFFYGLEEREYSYRIIKAGWKILYQPDIVAIETTDEGGRASRIDQRTETLSNRYIISYLHTPMAPMIANFVLFTLFLVIKEGGRVNVGRALGKFSTWLKKPGRPARRPIDRHAQAYIRACGGAIWR
ncbi:N/A [soil metagenome]